jgi:serine/threonine protein kinase
MEYVDGTTITQWLANEASDWRAVVQRFVEAGHGLAAAHDAGILHRDFKPQNVLVGRDGRVRVTDFGLARASGGPASMRHLSQGPTAVSPHQLTEVGAVLGTPAYMAPEQLQGEEVDARADVFSFCVALYEALFGVRPYAAPTIRELGWQMMQGNIQPPPDTRGVPNELIRVLHTGLRIAPAERPPSVRALLADIERAAGGDSHVRIHQWCQTLFAFCHVAVATWFTYDVFLKTSAPSTATSAVGPSPTIGTGMSIAAVFIIIWGLVLMAFIYGGAFWAALNAFGLAKRKRWARRTTLLYGVAALTSCLGIPYGVYAIWSLTREASKHSLDE